MSQSRQPGVTASGADARPSLWLRMFGSTGQPPAWALVEYLVAGLVVGAVLGSILPHVKGALLSGLATVAQGRIKVWGLTDPDRISSRTPTFAITVPGKTPEQLAAELAEKNIYVWHGNMYALALSVDLPSYIAFAAGVK